MSRLEPVTVEAARARGRSRYVDHAVGWATSGEWPDAALDLPLHPPSEAEAFADVDASVRWVASWRAADSAIGDRDGEGEGVVWGSRRWANLGTQQVPERLVFRTPGALAQFIGEAPHWDTLSTRVGAAVERWGAAVRPVLRRHAKALVEMPADDAARLLAAVTWLVEHPGSGLYLRQLPIEGLSTKWIEKRRAFVTGLVTAVTGRDDLGLHEAPRTVRVRALDAALLPGGLRDVSAPAEELDALPTAPRHVVVVENLQTFLALPPLPGTVAVHGAGYAADALGQIGWVREAPVLYWGDLDRDGFAILDRVRAHCVQVESLLMDEATLLEHRHLWVPDPTRDRAPALSRLTNEEERTCHLLGVHGGVRLEQERLAWPLCVQALVARLGGS